MVFSSLIFLFIFLPAFFLTYYVLPERAKNAWVLFASGIFYAWGAPLFLPVIILTSFVDFRISLLLKQPGARRVWLLRFAIAMNVAVLIYFKYSNFFVGELNGVLRSHGVEPFGWTKIALPIGISFITFEKISYLVDVWKGRVEAASSFGTYLLFLALFPHLIAGPIFRYHDIAPQLAKRRVSLLEIQYGIERLALGLAKKTLIADQLARVADKTFNMSMNDLTPELAWIGAFAYAFQIYFDFSGYSDMAIGLGRMMGFHFLENFDRPYTSQSVTEFWRRWHISLSNWMREYLYIPLGGNRGSTFRTYLNLWIVFLISGFWHGANWTFLFWGFYHGLFLVIERLGVLRLLEKLPKALRLVYTFSAVLTGWIAFRAASIGDAWDYFRRMLSPLWHEAAVRGPLLAEVINNRQMFILALAALISFLPAFSPRLERAAGPVDAPAATVLLRGAAALVCLFLATLSLVNSHFHPFIYFRF